MHDFSAMKRPIYIIGAGAIGKALAVFLQLNQRQVTLIRGSLTSGEPSLQTISVVTADGVPETEIAVDFLSNFDALNGLIVITSKSFGNEKLALELKAKVGDSPVILLQNGLGVEQPFINKHFLNIYRCVLYVTSQPIQENEIRFKPVADCPIGTIKGSELLLSEIIENLDTPRFRFVAEPDIQPIIWKKAIVNSVFNSVCPLLETDNGIFYRNAAAQEMAKHIITECLTIAQAKGISLGMNEVLDSLLNISRSSDGQLISTLQDIRNGRQTEIETLNGAIVAIARQMNMEHLVTETKLLGEMTQLKATLKLKT